MSAFQISGPSAFIPVVTSFPASPADNDEVFLQVGSGDNAVLWHMKYDADITDSYKWRYVGGPRLFDSLVTSATINSATYTELNSGLPQITLPYIGIYEFLIGHEESGTNAFVLSNVKTNGSNPGNDDDAFVGAPVGTNAIAGGDRTFRRDVSSFSTNALAVSVYRSGVSSSVLKRYIGATPVRLSGT